ncbi:hypothetical protein chiPu_0014523 [Chiloscyllium punctatum]|uniref:HTH CENPB-type domain-containing protein n=1 Tax=Chiloscyllium punctatum TaxID=137246 RepID=A0A401T055_CHIPU|nr:hypothetical protein [Chiloscyllium punctatum]
MTESPTARSSRKRKRVVLTLKQKIEICQRLEQGEKRGQIMAEFNIGSSTIYDIRRQKQELLKFYTLSESSRSADKRRTLKKPKLEELDTVLYRWFALKRLEGIPMTRAMLIEKAKELYSELQLTDPCAFSEGWLTCFKLRHGIGHLDVSGGSTAAESRAQGPLCDRFAKIVGEHGLSPEQIYNADESGLLWRYLPESALPGSGEAHAEGLKKNKDRITVLVCANAAGTHQIKLFVVGKSKNPCVFKNLRHLPVRYSAQSNSWMDVQLFTHWFHHVFVPSVKQHFRKIGKPEDSKCILLLDNCRAHPPESKLVSGNIFVIYLPLKVTALIQPMDQGIIENLKCHYRKNLLRKLLSSNEKITKFQNVYTLEDAVYNVACAWKLVKPQTLRCAWHKLLPNVSLSSDEEFEDFRVCQKKSTVMEMVLMMKNVQSDENLMCKFSEQELELWVDVDKDVRHVLNDDEIIKTVLNPTKESESERNTDEELHEVRVSWAKAAEAFQVLLKFAETQNCYTAQEVIRLHLLHSTFLQKKQDYFKLADIQDLFKKENVESGGDP